MSGPVATPAGPAVTVYLGAGGVGKTTVAAASAMGAALAGRRVVVLTVDPARRLADVLGLGPADGNDAAGDEPVLVPGPWPGHLWATQLDAGATLSGLLDRHARPGQAERLRANETFQAITTSMPGLTEYMAAERLHQLAHDPRFDRVVVDTPPSRHGIEFLDGPRRLTGLLDNRLYRTVLAPPSGVLRSATSAAQLVVRRLARLVGMDLVDSVIRFVAELEGLDQGFRQRAAETSALLQGPGCTYRVVTAARTAPLAEAAWIGAGLASRGLRVDAVVANRLTPGGPDATGDAGRGPGRAALQRNLDQLRALASQEEALLGELVAALGSPDLVRLTDRARPLRGRDELLELARQLAPEPEPEPASVSRRPR